MKLEAPGVQMTILPEHGGRVSSLLVDGWELMVPSGRDIFHWGSFVLAPWTGRLRDGKLTFGGREYRFERNAG